MMPGVHWSLTAAKHDELVAPFIHPNLVHWSLSAYTWRAHFCGRPRVHYDGAPYDGSLVEHGEDEPWHYDTAALNATGSNPYEQSESAATAGAVDAFATEGTDDAFVPTKLKVA